MPFLKLTTNITLDEQMTTQLMQEFSSSLAKATGKPEQYVMVTVSGNNRMLFGASAAPLAYLECKSIGLTAQQAKVISSALSLIIIAKLGILADRIYIEFSNSPAEFWGWNGGTFG